MHHHRIRIGSSRFCCTCSSATLSRFDRYHFEGWLATWLCISGRPSCDRSAWRPEPGDAPTTRAGQPARQRREIRAIAAELPCRPLVWRTRWRSCWPLIDREPQRSPRRGAGGARGSPSGGVSLTDARWRWLPLGRCWRPGAEALIELSDRYGLRRVDDLADRLAARPRPRRVTPVSIRCSSRPANRGAHG